MLKTLREALTKQSLTAITSAEGLCRKMLMKEPLSGFLELGYSDRLTCDLDVNPAIGMCNDDGAVTEYIRGYLQHVGMLCAANQRNEELGGSTGRAVAADIKKAYSTVVVAQALVRDCAGPRAESLLRLSSRIDMSCLSPSMAALVRNHAPGAIPVPPAHVLAKPIEAAQPTLAPAKSDALPIQGTAATAARSPA